MKKLLPVAIVAILLFSPVYAKAGIMGEAWLKSHSHILEPGIPFRLDYDGEIEFPAVGSPGPYVSKEMFCVEHAASSSEAQLYTILSIDEDLADFGLTPLDYKKAAWLADYWFTHGQSTYVKTETQKAIWEITTPDLHYVYLDGMAGQDDDILAALAAALVLDSDLSEFDASNWLLAVNPTIGPDDKVTISTYQNYLIPNYPVPEPATMVLLGTGLISIAGLRRKIKRSKN